jgi:glycosyltransferase involved in cell wall biosynthesis
MEKLHKIDIMNVSIVIPTRNRKHTICYVLKSISKQDYPLDNLEVIVVDDNSTDGTFEEINRKLWNMKVKVLKTDWSPETSNAHQCRNLGLSEVKYELVLFLDSDMALSKRVLSELVKTYKNWEEKGEKVGVRGWWKQVSGFRYSKRRLSLNRYNYKKDINRSKKLQELLAMKDDVDPLRAFGGFLMVPSEYAKKVGGFAQDITVYGYDLMLSIRIKNEFGIRYVFCPEAYAVHKPLWGDETNRRFKSTYKKDEVAVNLKENLDRETRD